MPFVNYQPGATLGQIEQEYILQALRFFGGNRTAASRALGISPRTLQHRINEYRERGVQGIPAPTMGVRLSDPELVDSGLPCDTAP